jgi:hypothetical protein
MSDQVDTVRAPLAARWIKGKVPDKPLSTRQFATNNDSKVDAFYRRSSQKSQN